MMYVIRLDDILRDFLKRIRKVEDITKVSRSCMIVLKLAKIDFSPQ